MGMITVIGNLKGGSGKSTVAFNLAIWLAWHKRKVSVLDLDPQKTLTDLIELRQEEDYEPPIVMLPSDMPLDKLKDEEGDVLIDVGVANLPGMFTAISQADRVLIPVVPGQADVWSTQRFLGMIASHRPPKCEVLMFLNRTDALGGSKETKEASAAIAMLKSASVLPTRLSQRIWLCRSLSEGLAVFELSPNEKASHEFLGLAKALYPKIKAKQPWK
jgi:chromosome partitioning protein